MSTLRVSNIEAKADVSSPSVNEKVKVTNSNGELLIHIDGATSGITTVGISTSGESFRFDSNQNVTFFGSVTGTGLDVNGNADISGNLNVGGVLTYEDVTNIDSVGVVTARSGLQVTGGHIGVGVIPESWSNNLRAVQIGRQACVTGQTGANIIEISANAYHNSGWKYIESDTATSYYQYQGAHVFSSAPSGTADNAITFSEKLRITSAGDMGLGTATPTSFGPTFQVAGTDPALLLQDTATAVDYFGINIASGAVNTWFDDASAFVIHTATGLSGSGLSEKLRIDSSGRMLVGRNTNFTGSNAQYGLLQISGNSAGSAGDGRIVIGRGEVPTVANQSLGQINFVDNTAGEFASIKAFTDGSCGTNDYPGRIEFHTTSDAASAPTERVRINSSGNLIVDAGGDAQDIQLISHSANSGHGVVYLRGNASNESSTIQLNHYGHADYHVSAGRTGNGLFSITRTNGGSDGIIMNSSGVVTIGVINAGSNAKFEVNSTSGSISSATARINGGDTTTGAINTGSSLLFAGHAGDAGRDFASIFAGKENGTTGNYNAYLAFGTRLNGNPLAERLRIDSNGHLIQANYKKLFNQNNNHLALIAAGESTPTVYVSDSGNDSTGDGTSSSPFRTLTKAWNYIPKVFTHNQTARIMIKGTSYTIDTDYYMRGGASGGNWQWGPAVEIRSESGSQIDVYLRRGWRFENVDGLRFNHLNFICDNANGYLYFNSCARGKIYNTCDMTVSVTKGWSERVTYDNCQQFVDDMDIDVTSAASSGLGGLVVVRSKSSLSGTRYITKAGSVFGNSAVSVCDDSLVSCNWDVTNFATGYAFGYNHYNAETNGIGMLNGVTISNCTMGIRLRNNSFVRKYNLTYSGNSTNEDIQSGSFVN